MLTPHAHLQIAFFLRQLIGWWFFMLGYFKVFLVPGGVSQFTQNGFVDSYADSFLPAWSLHIAGYFDALGEVGCGAMLILGLGVRPATWILMAILVMVTFGHQINNPTYPLGDHVLGPAIGLVGIAILAGSRDRLALDRLILPKDKPEA